MAEKLKMHSPDLVMSNIERITKLFPNCVTEGTGTDGQITRKIDFDLLRQELSDEIVEGPIERYHLNWPGKREAMLAANAPIAKTLRPCREESVKFDTTKNLFIEGDNLEALKLLQETYLGKVKMIYIDPPYNTAKQFLYEDDFADDADTYFLKSMQVMHEDARMVQNFETEGRRHSNWLSHLFPRLKLAKNFLSDSGVIFLSIDDNEQENLVKLCDEVFGASNFLGLLPVVTNMKGRNDKGFAAQTHEYLLAYQKCDFTTLGLSLSTDKKAEFDQIDEFGKQFQWRDLRKRGGADTRAERPNLYYPIYVDPSDGTVSVVESTRFSESTAPVKSDGEDGRWRWEKATLQKRIDSVCAFRTTGKMPWKVSYKVYLNEPDGDEKRELPKSTWIGSEFSSDSGTKAVNALLPGIDAKMLTPKPLGLIDRILEIAVDQNDIVMDFYSGTGTTAHAVFKRFGSSARFIMIQLPEPCDEKSAAYKTGFRTIADVGKERLRRSIQSIRSPVLEGLGSETLGFRVLKVDSSNMKDVYYSPADTSQSMLSGLVDNIKPDRTGEDLLFQVLLDCGVDLGLPIKSEKIDGCEVFFVNDSEHAAPDLVACFDPDVPESLVKKIAAKLPLRAVFRDQCFTTDADKINVEQIFKQLSPNTQLKSL